jgi:hypothetical protein
MRVVQPRGQFPDHFRSNAQIVDGQQDHGLCVLILDCKCFCPNRMADLIAFISAAPKPVKSRRIVRRDIDLSHADSKFRLALKRIDRVSRQPSSNRDKANGGKTANSRGHANTL